MNKKIPWLLYGLIFILSVACSEEKARHYPEDQVVDETRFAKIKLAGDLDEPMEIAIADDGGVVVVERKGAIKYYDPATGAVSLVHTMKVFSGLEDGLLGVALDPEYAKNKFIYFFYSPAGESAVQRVSRFTMEGKMLDTLSEKIIIEIPTQRQECCHSAGSIAFGPDGNLFIAVGDNTNPHNPGYYNSIDERKGREYWDAQRTAGNTNDLRGKILRIHIEPDGTYTIPEGNLFSEGDSLARPEIYVMGCRNPYRISVDAKRGWLFWGDVGQNTIDNPARGPISYDEWNVAREAGFFGWPYFAGPNAAYADFNFATNETGAFFDPRSPVNASVNNTGMRDLPPAKGALIWYSYDESKDFQHLGTGGKSPIAGPVYYSDLYEEVRTDSSIALPSYYDGKLFIAEWLRDWINVVTLTADGKVQSIEPFMKNEKFSHPIELEVGPEGALYILEYGLNWFSKNEDAALYRIEYTRGNRAPVVKLTAKDPVGSIPLRVQFSSEGTFDPDSSTRLQFKWYFDGEEVQSEEEHPEYTFQKNGVYTVRLVVEDDQGKQTTTTTEVRAGNAMPSLELTVNGNQSFYWDKMPIAYAVKLQDKEDGSLDDGTIKSSDVTVNMSYSTMGTDMTLVEQSEELFNSSSTGWQLISNSDCKACHAISDKSVGPAYIDIAARYPDNKENVEKLAKKIISGGSGTWGENVMSAHPQLSQEQAEEMVSFILSLKNDSQATRPLPPEGTFVPDIHLKDRSTGDYILTASYKDDPVPGVGSNTVRQRIIFRHPVINAVAANGDKGIVKATRNVAFTTNGAWLSFERIDLTGVRTIAFKTSSQQAGGRLSVRTGAPGGEVIASVLIPKDNTKPLKEGHWISNTVKVKDTNGRHDLFIVFEGDSGAPVSESNALMLESLEFNP